MEQTKPTPFLCPGCCQPLWAHCHISADCLRYAAPIVPDVNNSSCMFPVLGLNVSFALHILSVFSVWCLPFQAFPKVSLIFRLLEPLTVLVWITNLFHNYPFVSLWWLCWLTSVLHTIMNTQQHQCPLWSVRRPFVLPELCCVLRPRPSLIDTRHVLDPAASIFTQWFSLWPLSWLQASAPVMTP